MALSPEFAFQGLYEGREDVQHQCPTLVQQRVELRVDAGIHDDRTRSVLNSHAADLLGGFPCLFDVVDERNAVGDETRSLELGQQAMANGFGGDTSAIGYVE